MNIQAVETAIAQICGWPNVKPCYTSLDACAEMEASLTVDQQFDYGEQLRKLSGNVGDRGGHFVPNGFGCFALAHLSAPQRTEAFLRLHGKWEGLCK